MGRAARHAAHLAVCPRCHCRRYHAPPPFTCVCAHAVTGLGRAALPYAERGGGWLWHKVLWCCGAVWLAVKWAAATYASFWMLTSLLLFFPALADTLADAMIDGFMAVLARYPAFYDWAQMDVPQAAVRFYTACTNVTIVWQ